MRKHHFHIQYFSFYDLDGMGRHLEEMAARGWMLERMTTFGWHYRRMEPKRLRFTVTYQDTFSVFDPEGSEGQQEYQDLCRQSGWEVAAANGPLQAFYTEDEDAPPIETDPQLVLETVERLAKKTRIPNLFTLLVALFNFWVLVGNVLRNPIHLLASPATLVGGICWTLLALYNVTELVTYGRWHRKAKAAAAVGEFVPVRSHARLLRVIVGTAVLSILYILLFSRMPGYGLLLVVILAGMCPIFIIPGVTHGILKRRGVPANVNRRWTIVANIGATLFTVVLQCMLVFSLVGNPAFYQEDDITAAPLAIADLTGITDDRYVQRVHVDRSLFLYDFACTEEAPFDDADLPELSYEIVDVKFPLFYNLCRDFLIDPGYGDGYTLRDPLPGVSAVYQHTKGYPSYILCWDTRLVRLSADWELTAEQLETAARNLAP
ncbi:DUF2812 domain-containing protein [Candidatus Avoscillospira sp. LCP25S3_F1]|uniref:DUF2812 domain-containing protein n=1 Tax=Candidatus Avoscillospira sp. LCP25S3_F1 TaxID=3438825 RepID=UPI003F92D1A2